ncbi:protein kinase family protein [Nocardioides sp. GY 10127]|uniref:protein kinase family protein n=1 Tax=Nocardioides sp. GY 10127 TaxID=2569762 RepID=UPI0014581B42|nr:protein kinase family protein [Nocardioides sp. GY 10127]
MPLANRPGDELAGRYRLVDLLSESRGGRFWRAHDRVLERHVAVHVIAEDDERADALLDAARRSATVLDPHILRVLDAARADGLCFVVNEWGSGTSLDTMLAAGGVLTPRQAAWVTAEVARACEVAHRSGVPHGRLVPESVLVDSSGSVRIIGWCVDAALHGLPAGSETTDLADLAGLLYAGLTRHWAGPSPSAVPGAPTDHGRVLRPRQVRAGIPRPLDSLCDDVLNSGSDAPQDAGGVAARLDDFVGDPTGIKASVVARLVTPEYRVTLPAVPDFAVRSRDADQPTQAWTRPPDPEVSDTPDTPDPTGSSAMEDAGEAGDDGDATQESVLGVPTGAAALAAGAAGITGSDGTDSPVEPGEAAENRADQPSGPDSADGVDVPTQASLPPQAEAAGSHRPSPGPPPEPPAPLTPRPLFAPEPADGRPARRARDTSATAPEPDPEYWPWEVTGSGVMPPVVDHTPPPADPRRPGRRTLTVAAVLLVVLGLFMALTVAWNIGRGRTPLGTEPVESSSSPAGGSSSQPAEAAKLTGLTATDLDPLADPPEENPDLAPNAVDGDPTTAWQTSTYLQDLGPNGLKTGVGLVVDLGAVSDVTSVELRLGGKPTGFSLYLTDDTMKTDPSSVAGLQAVATRKAAGTDVTVDLAEGSTGRYLTLWLTSLPAVQGGFRGVVREITVHGTQDGS